ncbi:hypothetical protein Bbelb_401460 [Branchiostoma belcheri]|nr:hypothetical protein Bbelb_401460 [Branchiostoma belcheri]
MAFCRSLRFLIIAIAVLALLGAGAGIIMYFTGTLGGPAEINMPSVVTDRDNWTTAMPVTTTVTATYLPVTLTNTAFLSATKLHRATNMFPPSNETATTPIPTAQTTSHDVVRAGKLPPVTTTLPHVTTTLPHVTTTLPHVTTTLPPVTTTLPHVTTTLPHVTTTLPKVTTTLPHVTTTLPHVTTTLPPVTTTLPRVITTLPQLTTKPPKMQCSKLTPPAKGYMTGSNSFRDKVYFRCDRGYKLVGDSPLTCQSDGTWSGPSPTCMKVAVCPGIRPPANGGYSGYVQVRRFFCEEGYTLVGASLLTCQSDGTWTGNPPTCRAECPNGYQLLAQTCIKVYSYEKDYAEALAVCEKDGATLAMPKTRELDFALRNLIRKVGVSLEYWIGLVKCDNIWKWADGSRLENYKLTDCGTTHQAEIKLQSTEGVTFVIKGSRTNTTQTALLMTEANIKQCHNDNSSVRIPTSDSPVTTNASTTDRATDRNTVYNETVAERSNARQRVAHEIALPIENTVNQCTSTQGMDNGNSVPPGENQSTPSIENSENHSALDLYHVTLAVSEQCVEVDRTQTAASTIYTCTEPTASSTNYMYNTSGEVVNHGHHDDIENNKQME